MTEDELRAALRSRTQQVPGTPGLAERAEKQGRRQQAGLRAAGAAGLVAALAISAVAVLPRTTATPTPPATGSPTASASEGGDVVRQTSTLDGLTVTTSGPAAVAGTAPFELTVRLRNDGSTAWSGNVAVGLVSAALVPGYFEGGVITSAQQDSAPANLGATLEEGRVFEGVLRSDVTIDARTEKELTFSVVRDLRVSVPAGGVQGWSAWLDRTSVDPSDAGRARTAMSQPTRAISFSPLESNLPCASVAIETYDDGEKGPWQLSEAYSATVGGDRAATWSAADGLGVSGLNVTTDRPDDVRSSVVIAALGSAGLAGASGFGPATPDRPATLDPGRYVAYSGARTQSVSFVGSCGDGKPITGTFVHYVDATTGLLDCATTRTASLTQLAALAEKYCPKP